jgi:polysaccharide pyruvyl transferase WcaK-like protein
VSVLSFDPEHTRRFHGLDAAAQWPSGPRGWARGILRGTARESFKELAACDVLLLGGGGFLSDWQPEAPWFWLRQALFARLLGKPVMLYGVGAGPFSRPMGKWITRTLIRWLVSCTTVRDEGSRDWLVKAGVPRARITVLADPVFGLDAAVPAFPRDVRRVAFCVAPIFHLEAYWPGQRSRYEAYLEQLAQACRALKETGFQPVFIPMQADTDLEVARAIQAKVPGTLEILPLPDSLRGAMELLSSMETVVAMRLHAGMLAALQGVPPVGIIYHPKVASFLDAIGMRGHAEELGDGSNWREASVDAGRLVATILEVIHRRDELSESIRTRIQPQRRLAQQIALEALRLRGTQ